VEILQQLSLAPAAKKNQRASGGRQTREEKEKNPRKRRKRKEPPKKKKKKEKCRQGSINAGLLACFHPSSTLMSLSPSLMLRCNSPPRNAGG
jgi:hypothetical protein